MNKDDLRLKQDVEDELRWDPRVDAARIVVAVSNGDVALVGAVDSYAQKRAAESAGQRVGGASVLIDDLTVCVPSSLRHADREIAEAALAALKWDVLVPKTVTAKMKAGSLTLEGRVDWNYQRDAAERAVHNLEGVTSLSNAIKVKVSVTPALAREHVLAALQRHAVTDLHAVQVEISGGVVTLSGKVASCHAIDDATAAAWSAPGVSDVVQLMQVSSHE